MNNNKKALGQSQESKTIIIKSDGKQQINLTKIYVDETCSQTAGVCRHFAFAHYIGFTPKLNKDDAEGWQNG